ncbi:mannose-6-phosphate isomerase class I [Paenibacillus castaneae]|uniref:class I mannose-6-phosphate isomerase n=1 Tax=Paenibacillus castaneae TaxID=474957 RepID=UPI001ABA314E|nr:class I mannose-6-phosphate isomerase [Paenibacillus castaneae]NIK78726.1 mannose-6-phosphate isomerase class I [Paenibacillus castaneae]
MANFNMYPEVLVSKSNEHAWQDYENIKSELKSAINRLGKQKTIVTIDCYPGVQLEELRANLVSVMESSHTLFTDDLYYSSEKVTDMIQFNLTDDRVFGKMSLHNFADFLDVERLEAARSDVSNIDNGLIIIYGTGATLVYEPDILVYADLARWEIQRRYSHNEISNWKANNRNEDAVRKIKRGYFFEWQVADRHKRKLFEKIDYLLDTNTNNEPKLVEGATYLAGLMQTVNQPFSVVPYFAPGVWGGQWMKEKLGLDPSVENYAWSFNGVPEENSLFLRFGDVKVEVPAINAVLRHPVELLGEKVYGRFGADFPIRFNFLDTFEGGNLSLQVHPLVEYVQQTFGVHYTQDESYYIVDAEEDAIVYLGVKDGIDSNEMIGDLQRSYEEGCKFDDEKYINQFPAQKHDHFLIPAGTIHSQGKDSLVLEISATPNYFTFKLWDWERLGMDGLPRPVHLEHGIANIQWERDETWARENIINRIEKVDEGAGWIEEKTGLHEREFIETRRHWFTEPVIHNTNGGVNVLNLIEGEEAIVESPTAAFEPFVVHYAETFIIPAVVGSYSIRPYGSSVGKEIGTIKAYVRT